MTQLSLPADLEEFVADLVKSGAYPTASEAIRDGLRLLQDREHLRRIKLEALRREIAKGIEEADRGELVEGVEAFRLLREKAAARSPRIEPAAP